MKALGRDVNLYPNAGPEYAVRLAQYLVDSKFIPIAPLPVVNPKASNFKDLLNMFIRDYLESIYSHFLARARRSDDYLLLGLTWLGDYDVAISYGRYQDVFPRRTTL